MTNSFVKNKLGFSFIISLCVIPNLHALDFYFGDIEGSFDTKVSIGSSWRIEAQDKDLADNLEGTNAEDGNMNFSKGDVFSQVFKGNHDLQLDYKNVGLFIRGKYWYDKALKGNKVDYGHAPTAQVGTEPLQPLSIQHAGRSKLDDSGFNRYAKFSGAEVLDAFVYGDFDLGDSVLDLRLGKQVISWGESTFILGGVNSINPIDVNAFTRPGAEIKEGLIPVNMAFANVSFNESLSAELFYQLEFQETVLPGCGTYFSTNDYAPEGCNLVSLRELNMTVERAKNGNQKAKDHDQYGVALRFVSESLNSTEFGFYGMNIHSRTPSISGVKNNIDEIAIGQAAGMDWIINNSENPLSPTPEELSNAAMFGQQVAMVSVVADTKYRVSYEEDINIFGTSIATTIGGTAISGEISYKSNVPVQMNASQLIAASIMGDTSSLAPEGMNATEIDASTALVEEGGTINGFRNFDIAQAQVTGIHFIDRMAGSDRVTLIGEVGFTQIQKFAEGADQIKFGSPVLNGAESSTGGFVTQEAWGYRGRIIAEYSSIFPGVNLTPSLAWSHDVKGFSPDNSSGFKEGQQSLGIGLAANYRSLYSASLAYNQFMGGKYSVVSDRDYVSLSLALNF